MNIRKILSVFMIFTVTFFRGCSSSNGEYIPPDQVARNQSEIIINSVKNKDLDSLKEILCEALKEKEDVDTQIQDFFEFLDGNITSHDIPYGSVRSKKTTPEETILLGLGGEISNIKTDKGKNYLIMFYSYNINKEHDDYVGVVSISILDKGAYDPETGYPDGAGKSIGLKN